MAGDNENILDEWCLIESNPCIFYDMLKRMGASKISVEDVYSLSYFDDYINNKENIHMNHILGVDKYMGEKNKALDKENKENNVVDNVVDLYKNDICIEDKYNKLLKHHSYIYGIIFLFNIGKNYKRNKYIEHNVPDNLFFAKQVIPNACATQAILSIVLNKDIELNDEIKNIKTFSLNFDSSMKGLTLSNCTFLRNIHNSYKPPIYLDKDDIHHDKKKSEDAFHFVSYINFDDKVYLLDGLQNGPVLINAHDENKATPNNNSNNNNNNENNNNNNNNNDKHWLEISREHIKKEIDEICNSQTDNDVRFNIIAVMKDKEYIIQEFINIHRILKQRVNIKLIDLGEDIELLDEINEDDFPLLNDIPSIENLPNNIETLYNIVNKSNLEINYLLSLLHEQTEIKKLWNKELTFKFFNFYPFIMSSLNLLAKHKILKDAYQKEKEKNKTHS
ncbi:deubiquinating/deneddylating enzyme [Plasmodium sp. DRC-Itaito]|nr:deubiquinating/deneddylating enzyme [Plasmodium sp. DRC-Itaito]